MDKTLVRVGNSLAVVVDSSLRRVLGIGRRTRMKMWTDGKRLILEPLPPDPIAHVEEPGRAELGDERRLSIDAFPVWRALSGRWNMWQPQYDELSHRGDHWLAFGTWCEIGLPEATPADYELLRRMEALLAALDSGQRWPEAIATALAKVPRRS